MLYREPSSIRVFDVGLDLADSFEVTADRAAHRFVDREFINELSNQAFIIFNQAKFYDNELSLRLSGRS